MIFFFFRHRTANEMRITDGSSDVGAPDLRDVANRVLGTGKTSLKQRDSVFERVWWCRAASPPRTNGTRHPRQDSPNIFLEPGRDRRSPPPVRPCSTEDDRKSVVEGTRVSVRVDLGGRRIYKKKNRR